MISQPTAIVGHLVSTFPELKARFRDHVFELDGVLPHVFMADVERFAEELLASSKVRLGDLLQFLEDGIASADPAVVNLIDVTFIASLPYAGEPNSELRDCLPDGLRGLLRH
jgi:hypothetical protein